MGLYSILCLSLICLHKIPRKSLIFCYSILLNYMKYLDITLLSRKRTAQNFN